MFPIDAFRSTLSKAEEILRLHEISFHLTGGIASIFYGEPRMTQDIDIVIDNEAISRNIESFLTSLTESDFILMRIQFGRQFPTTECFSCSITPNHSSWTFTRENWCPVS